MIKVVLEPKELHTSPAEECYFCGRETRYWDNEKDVAVCVQCSIHHSPKEIKSKEEWVRRVRILRNKKKTNSTSKDNILLFKGR